MIDGFRCFYFIYFLNSGFSLYFFINPSLTLQPPTYSANFLNRNYFQFQFNGATYHSNLQVLAGGVGRNIAEGISKFDGNDVHLISVVGNDQVCVLFIFNFVYKVKEVYANNFIHIHRMVTF